MIDTSTMREYKIAHHINSIEEVFGYLNAALAYGDEEFFRSLGDISKSKGMNDLAKKTGLSREALYRSLSGNTKPRFDTIAKVIDGLGMKFEIVPKDKIIT